MEYFTEKWTISGPFVPQIRALFSVFKKRARAVFPLPSHSCAPEYTKCVCSALEKCFCSAFKSLQWINLTFMFPVESETPYDFINVFISLNNAFLFMTLTYRFKWRQQQNINFFLQFCKTPRLKLSSKVKPVY